MVQLYEDQILRGKDMNARAELARKVARMWEEQLADPREAADAWRRVLRMKPGDAEATQGLERSKNPIRTWVHSARRDKAPAHDASSINDEQRALAGPILLAVHTVSPRYRAFRLKVGEQRKAQVAH